VNKEISRDNLIYLGDDDFSAKIVGVRERFTFLPYSQPTGMLKNLRPAAITRSQCSKWKNAGKKKSEKYLIQYLTTRNL
jgi:hypothetical protein